MTSLLFYIGPDHGSQDVAKQGAGGLVARDSPDISLEIIVEVIRASRVPVDFCRWTLDIFA